MESVVVNQYRVYCITEATNVYIWGTTPPTKCCNNTTHEINLNSINIIQTLSNNIVTVKEENTPTQGNYRCKQLSLDIPADTTLNYDLSWPYAINILQVNIMGCESQRGDTINVIVGPNTIVGAIISSVSPGQTVISVSPTVIQNVNMGYKINITDNLANSARTDDLGEVSSINPANSTVTVTTPATKSYSPLTPTYVRLHVCTLEDFEFGNSFMYVIGNAKIGGTYLPAGKTVRMVYKNVGNVQHRLVASMEYLY